MAKSKPTVFMFISKELLIVAYASQIKTLAVKRLLSFLRSFQEKNHVLHFITICVFFIPTLKYFHKIDLKRVSIIATAENIMYD